MRRGISGGGPPGGAEGEGGGPDMTRWSQGVSVSMPDSRMGESRRKGGRRRKERRVPNRNLFAKKFLGALVLHRFDVQPRPPLHASSLLESFELPDNTHTTLKVNDTWRGSAKKIRVAKKTLDETAPALFLSFSFEIACRSYCPIGGPASPLLLFVRQASLRIRARPVPFCQLLSTQRVRR